MPVLFHIHGGAYVSGLKSESFTMFKHWLDRGYGVVSPQYSFLDKGESVSIMDIYQVRTCKLSMDEG